MDRRWSGLVIVLGSGCSQLFGLDSPSLASDAQVPDVADSGMAGPCLTLRLRDVDDDDADGIADTLDTCFGLPGAQMDTDGDGIGDKCDERVGTDTRSCVWTFRTPAMGETATIWDQAWVLMGGWTIIDSKLEHTSTAVLRYANPRQVFFDVEDGIAFDTYIRLAGYTAPMVYGGGFEVESSLMESIECELVQQGSSGAGVLQLMQNGLMRDSQSLSIATPMNVNAYVRLSASVENGTFTVRCTLDPDIALTGVITLQFSDAVSTPVPRMRPRLLADRANVSFDHIALYKLGRN